MQSKGLKPYQLRGKAAPLWNRHELKLARSMWERGDCPVVISVEIFEALGIERTEAAIKKKAQKSGWPRKLRYQKWLDSDVALLVGMVNAGTPRREMPRILGVSHKRLAGKLYRMGLHREAPNQTNPSPWTESDQRRLRQLASKRLSAPEIAKEIGRTPSSVIGRAWRTGVDLARPAGWNGVRR